MQTVDVLRHNGGKIAAALQLRERIMSGVRLCREVDKAGSIKIEELRRMRHEKRVRCHLFGRVFLVQRLAVDAARTAKIRNARLRRHPCAPKEDSAPASSKNIPELCNFIHENLLPLMHVSNLIVSIHLQEINHSFALRSNYYSCNFIR